MSKVQRKPWTIQDYEQAAEEYLRELPLEHFMEATPHSTQRKITLESFDLLATRLADVQLFSELLVQYFHRGKLRQVVPDNMAQRSLVDARSLTCFNVEHEKDQLVLVMEYVSQHSQRKDYEESFLKYQRELKVPYCLMFYPEKQDLRVYCHTGKRYQRPATNTAGRYEIPELELEVGLLDKWVRFWHRAQLLLLPADLQKQLDQAEKRAEREAHRADEAEQRADKAESELAQLRELLAKLKGGKKNGGNHGKSK